MQEYTFDHPDFTVSNFMEIQMVFKGLNTYIIGAGVLLRILEPKNSNNVTRKESTSFSIRKYTSVVLDSIDS